MLARDGDAAGAAAVLAAHGAPRGAVHAPLYRHICEGVLALGAGVDQVQVGSYADGRQLSHCQVLACWAIAKSLPAGPLPSPCLLLLSPWNIAEINIS